MLGSTQIRVFLFVAPVLSASKQGQRTTSRFYFIPRETDVAWNWTNQTDVAAYRQLQLLLVRRRGSSALAVSFCSWHVLFFSASRLQQKQGWSRASMQLSQANGSSCSYNQLRLYCGLHHTTNQVPEFLYWNRPWIQSLISLIIWINHIQYSLDSRAHWMHEE